MTEQGTEPEVETETNTVKFYNPHEGLWGTGGGGPYIWQEQAEMAERQNAFAEGREPVLDGSRWAYVGAVPVTAANLTDNRFQGVHMDNMPVSALGPDPEHLTSEPLELEVTTVKAQPVDISQKPATETPTPTGTSKTAAPSTPPSSSGSTTTTTSGTTTQ